MRLTQPIRTPAAKAGKSWSNERAIARSLWPGLEFGEASFHSLGRTHQPGPFLFSGLGLSGGVNPTLNVHPDAASFFSKAGHLPNEDFFATWAMSHDPWHRARKM
jgi:hypothetical protein